MRGRGASLVFRALATDLRFHTSNGPTSTVCRRIAHHIENKSVTVNRQSRGTLHWACLIENQPKNPHNLLTVQHLIIVASFVGISSQVTDNARLDSSGFDWVRLSLPFLLRVGPQTQAPD